jgi:hypothetical protein
MEAKSKPVASSTRMREVAAATTAPAKMAPQDTADVLDSTVAGTRAAVPLVIVRSSIGVAFNGVSTVLRAE